MAQVGVEPTASLVLSESGLPVAYRAMRDCRVVKEPTQQVPGVGFEPTRTGSKPASLPVSRPRSVTTEYTEHTEMENTRVPRSTRFLSVSSVSSVVFLLTEYTEHTEMENTRVPRSTRFLSV